MLLFNFPSRKPSHKLTGISIHFMLLFNGVYEDGFQKGFIFQYIICCYSTNTILFNFIKSRPFQYIICCYSTINKASLPRTFPNFNTSYVIIQLFRQSSLLLFFNTSYVIIQLSGDTWRDTQIKISIHSMLLFNLFMSLFTLVCPHFNTSYVVIQRK